MAVCLTERGGQVSDVESQTAGKQLERLEWSSSGQKSKEKGLLHLTKV